MTFGEIVAHLRDYDQTPFDGRAPSIFVADPWAATSDAVVEWSGEKGGVPWHRKPLLYYLVTVREALEFFGAEYDDRVARGDVDAMCAKLGYHVKQRNEQRLHRTKADM
jgi:hypothetical protein